MRYDRDDPEYRPHDRGVRGLPMFGEWPTYPPADAEQDALPLDGTIQGAYAAWLATSDGERAFRAFGMMAQRDARDGVRLSAKSITERVRAMLKLKINNSFTALLARDAERSWPELRGQFEKRERTAV